MRNIIFLCNERSVWISHIYPAMQYSSLSYPSYRNLCRHPHASLGVYPFHVDAVVQWCHCVHKRKMLSHDSIPTQNRFHTASGENWSINYSIGKLANLCLTVYEKEKNNFSSQSKIHGTYISSNPNTLELSFTQWDGSAFTDEDDM